MENGKKTTTFEIKQIINSLRKRCFFMLRIEDLATNTVPLFNKEITGRNPIEKVESQRIFLL
jgi:hypothetical protein